MNNTKKLTHKQQELIELQTACIEAHKRAHALATSLFSVGPHQAAFDQLVIDIYDRMPADEEDEADFAAFLGAAAGIAKMCQEPTPQTVLAVFDRIEDFGGNRDEFVAALRFAVASAHEVFGHDPEPNIVLEMFDALNGSDEDEEDEN